MKSVEKNSSWDTVEMMETSDFFFGFGTGKQKGWYNLRRGQTTATFTGVRDPQKETITIQRWAQKHQLQVRAW